ncbi:MAG: SAM-dependent chlorinase/fluorinase [Candidatus Latescibacterota bacterium]|nr:SAM-dependent chlorinase/fluorinase [Candidatus Latescibacterota bacterium]
MGVVTLTTDFGTRDSYVGAMKGVLLSQAPFPFLVDISHEIPAQDVHAGAFLLSQAAREFPTGTIHLAVVDPGVGGPRRPIVVQSDDYLWVGPDNGLFSFALDRPDAIVYEINLVELRRTPMSATFHGRDLFAPTAARLHGGLAAGDVGPRISDPIVLDDTAVEVNAEWVQGRVVYVDHFGNLITGINRDQLSAGAVASGVTVQGLEDPIPVVESYDAVAKGELLAIVGSTDLLEIAVRDGSAASRLALARGAPVRVGRH